MARRAGGVSAKVVGASRGEWNSEVWRLRGGVVARGGGQQRPEPPAVGPAPDTGGQRSLRAHAPRATVYDVAERAGVSIKTVSRVVTGAGSVSPDTRRRVEDAVAALSYVPNMAARSLRVGVGDTIGVIIDSIADPFFAALDRGDRGRRARTRNERRHRVDRA